MALKIALKRSLNFSVFIEMTGTLILAHCVKFDLPIIVGKNKDSKRAQCVLVVPDVMRSAQELFVF